MKKILIALDYDPSAEKIAKTGYEIARATDAKVVLLHVVGDANYYFDMAYSPIMGFNGYIYPGIDEMVVKDLMEESHHFLERSKEYLGDNAVETMVKEGDFVEILLKTAEETSADLIVLGTHSRRGFDKFMNGSLAEKVLEKSSVPLLIIPNNEVEQ